LTLPADKRSVLGILVNPTTYEQVVSAVIDAAAAQRSMRITALAVHGVMEGVLDRQFRYRLNQFELVLPDGQPVRWALRLLYGVKLADRVYGPTLTLHLCEAAEQRSIRVYFYGSTESTLGALRRNLETRYPKLRIVGAEPSKFRRLTAEEKLQTVERIRASGAQIVFIGLGCPRQEIWAYEYQPSLDLPILAVGAAFDFLGGTKPQAPRWMQRYGLEWLFRFLHEPRRLWRRYLLLNPTFLLLLMLQALKLKHFDSNGEPAATVYQYG
jgi:exopolysaccharide biosynthesis WecB/TagA/CpsF family protein